VVVSSFVVAPLVSVPLALALAYLTYERRVPGTWFFIMILVVTVLRELARAELVLTSNMNGQVLCTKLIAVVNHLTPVLWLLFALTYSAPRRKIRTGVLVLFWVIPVTGILLMVTNDWHHLVWRSITRASGTPGASLVLTHGPWFLIAAIYGFVFLLSGILIMIRAFTRFPVYYRGQVAVIFLAVICYGASNAIYDIGFSPFPALDLTSIGVAAAEGIWLWGIFRFRIFGLLPVARDLVIDSMSDGVIVLDTMRRIVDINPAALGMLGASEASPIGREIREVWKDWPDLEEVALPAAPGITREICAPGDTAFYFEVRTVPLLPRPHQASGMLVLLRDVTDRRRAEAALQSANAELQAQLAENLMLQERLRAEAIRDPLTNLYNRRFLYETLYRELAHASRERLPLAVVMIDIDRFKELNDRHGHQAGDVVLQALAKLLLASTRAEDVVCRYGGEEVVIVLPGAGLADAMRRVETWREDFAHLEVPFEARRLTATFSAGVADFPLAGRSGEDLLRVSDQALYAAKHAGRNCVVAWQATADMHAGPRQALARATTRARSTSGLP
jgi:diguanylate cyclase (GGDEF)-like protein/PAS domain S-box-containing protein